MSRHTQLDHILTALTNQLRQLYGERLVKVILYGSQARGDAQPDSDIDVMIVLKGEVNVIEEIERTSELNAALSLQYETVISLFFISQARFEQDEATPLLKNVRREGLSVA